MGLNEMLRVVDIVDGTSVDGPGFRTSIYFGGCKHHCIGCHNPSTWPEDAGEQMSVNDILMRIDKNEMAVTFSGGDPLFQIDKLLPLAEEIKRRGISLWCYTGYLFEDIVADESLCRILAFVDVIVDGPFVLSLRDTSLPFRGSSNQRIIDVEHWRKTKEIRLWESDF